MTQPILIDESDVAARAINAACTAFSVSRQQLLSKSRLAFICNARRAACSLMAEAGLSSPHVIARYILRTHATVYHHIETHRNYYKTDPKYRATYDNAFSIMGKTAAADPAEQ